MLRTFSAVIAVLSICGIARADDDTSAIPLIAFFTSGAKPAVDGTNGKLELSGGASQFYSGMTPISQPLQIDNDSQSSWSGVGLGIGTITTPIGHDFGLQVDMGAGTLRGSPIGTASGHLFWRDPDKGMMGVYGQGNYWAFSSGSNSWKAAAEIEGFYGQITLRGLFGAQGFGYNYSPNESLNYSRNQNLPDRFFNLALARYYVTDDLMLAAGEKYINGRGAGVVRAELLPSQFRGNAIAPTIFIRGQFAPENNNSIIAGMRIYFGNSDKTLIRRHREDDPEWDEAE